MFDIRAAGVGLLLLGLAACTQLPPNLQAHTPHTPYAFQKGCELCGLYVASKRGVVKIHSKTTAGAGVIVTRSGIVVTSEHVVRGSSELRITLFGNVERKGKLIKTDPKLDLALIQIEEPPSNLAPIPLEEDNAVWEGQRVIVVGHPLSLDWTITSGIVSRVRGPKDPSIPDILQTDAAISPGNSGGPVLNLDGHCVGIVMSKLIGRDAENLNFARPVKFVRRLLAGVGDSGHPMNQTGGSP